MEYVYFISTKGLKYVKIGRAQFIDRRRRMLQIGNRYTLHVLAYYYGDAEREAEFHCQFDYARVRAEWFRMTHELWHVITDKDAMGVHKQLCRSRQPPATAALDDDLRHSFADRKVKRLENAKRDKMARDMVRRKNESRQRDFDRMLARSHVRANSKAS